MITLLTPPRPTPSVRALCSHISAHTADSQVIRLGGAFAATASFCSFDGRLLTPLRLLGPTAAECTSPPLATSGRVALAIAAPGGHSVAELAERFEYVRPLVLASLLPAQGPSEGGTEVEVWGEGFSARGAALAYLRCAFNESLVPARLEACATTCAAGQ